MHSSRTTYSSTSFASPWGIRAEFSARDAAENNALANSAQQRSNLRDQHLLDTVFKPPETCNTDLSQQMFYQAIGDVRTLSGRIKSMEDKCALKLARNVNERRMLKFQLAKAITQVYTILGNTPLPLRDSPNLAKQQNQLVHSSLVAEERRYNLFSLLSANPKIHEQQMRRHEGGNRFLTQVSFLGYLDSIDGVQVRENLESAMSIEEKGIFAKTINYLVQDLAPQYIDLLSQIEVEKYLAHTGVIGKRDKDYYSEIGSKFNKLVACRLNTNESCIFPLGWELPSEQVGHHMLLWADKEESSAGKISIRYVDTTVIEENTTVSKTHIVSQALGGFGTGEKENNNSSNLFSIKRCSIGFSDVELSNAIDRLARILMLQISDFTSQSIGNCKNNDPGMFLLKVNYSLGAEAKQLVDEETPLSSWKWHHSPSCALASFQPLLQEIAKKFLHHENIINPELEQHLRGYFELLMQSYKSSLVNRFLKEQSSDTDSYEMWLKRAYTHAIYEEACATIHQEKLIFKPHDDDQLPTEKIFKS